MKVGVVVGICVAGSIGLCLALSFLFCVIVRNKHRRALADVEQRSNAQQLPASSYNASTFLSTHPAWPETSVNVLSQQSHTSVFQPDRAYGPVPKPTRQPRNDSAGRGLTHEASRSTQSSRSRRGPKRKHSALGLRDLQPCVLSAIVESPQTNHEVHGDPSTLAALHGEQGTALDENPNQWMRDPTELLLRGPSPLSPPSPPSFTIASLKHLPGRAMRMFSAPDMPAQGAAAQVQLDQRPPLVRSTSVGGHSSGLAPTTSLPPLPAGVNRDSITRPLSYCSYMSDDTAASSVLWDSSSPQDEAAIQSRDRNADSAATAGQQEDDAGTASDKTSLRLSMISATRPNTAAPAKRQNSSYSILPRGSLSSTRRSRQMKTPSPEPGEIIGTAYLENHIEDIKSLDSRPPSTSRSSASGPSAWRQRKSSLMPILQEATFPVATPTSYSHQDSTRIGHQLPTPPDSAGYTQASFGSTLVPQSERHSVASLPPAKSQDAAEASHASHQSTSSMHSSSRSVTKSPAGEDHNSNRRPRTKSHKKSLGVTPYSSTNTVASLTSQVSGAPTRDEAEASIRAPSSEVTLANTARSSSSASSTSYTYWTPATDANSLQHTFKFPEVNVPQRQQDSPVHADNRSRDSSQSDSKSRRASPKPVSRSSTPPPAQRWRKSTMSLENVPPVPIVPRFRFMPSRGSLLAPSTMPRESAPDPKSDRPHEASKGYLPPSETIPRSQPPHTLLKSAQALRRMNSEALEQSDVAFLRDEQSYTHLGMQPKRLVSKSGEPISVPWFSFRNVPGPADVDSDRETDSITDAGSETRHAHREGAQSFWVSDAEQAAREMRSPASRASEGIALDSQEMQMAWRNEQATEPI